MPHYANLNGTTTVAVVTVGGVALNHDAQLLSSDISASALAELNDDPRVDLTDNPPPEAQPAERLQPAEQVQPAESGRRSAEPAGSGWLGRALRLLDR